MADRVEWARRVSEWRASGKSSPEFCKGKPFSPGGLRFWAHELGRSAGKGKAVEPKPVLRIRQVVRVPASASKITRGSAAATRAPAVRGPTPAPPLIVELGGARITVPPGADRGALAMVLDLLAGAGVRA